MSTSETSITNLYNKIAVLSVLPNVKDEWAKKFVSMWDMSIPLAVAVQLDWVSELSDKGCEEIEKCFVALCNTFDKTEAEMLEIALEQSLDEQAGDLDFSRCSKISQIDNIVK